MEALTSRHSSPNCGYGANTLMITSQGCWTADVLQRRGHAYVMGKLSQPGTTVATATG